MNRANFVTGFSGLAALALGLVCSTPVVLAQAAPQAGGPPARAVRLSYVDGQVKLIQGGQVLASQAVANTPLFEGMQLATTDSGKAEIQFEDGSVARLSPDTTVTIAALRGQGTSGDAQLLVNRGLAYFELQGGNLAGPISVLFGNSVATASGFTVLRVNMDNPPGALAVFSGNAHLQIAGAANSVDLHGGESVALNAADPNAFRPSESIEPDSWDAFNSDRDQALTTLASTQTSARADMGESQNPAWSDLDANGNWYDVPGQGYVWSPYDAASNGFDPYGNGNWMLNPGYGYVWASSYPWGYLPFQCGAWNFYGGFGWGWAPGMGGCRPWWGLGFYGGPNIGYAPGGYSPIVRPITPVRLPRGGPAPVYPVHRTPLGMSSTLAARNMNRPMTINGATVQALRPIPSRAVFDRNVAAVQSHGFVAKPGTQTVNGQTAGTRPGYVRPAGLMPGQHSAQTYRGPNSNAGSQVRSNTTGNSASHPSAASSPHPSGGYSGGGGGGGHPSGGGGGGGSGHH